MNVPDFSSLLRRNMFSLRERLFLSDNLIVAHIVHSPSFLTNSIHLKWCSELLNF